MKLWAVVTAAGSGKRMGGGNKLLLPLLGEPVLVHTLRRFANVDGVVVSAPPGEESVYEELFARFDLRCVRRVVTGGAERQDSIRNALGYVEGADAVAIHDGARPLFGAALLAEGVQALAAGADGALPMVAVKDTIKRVGKDGVVLETLVRSELYAAQTPQFFDYSQVVEAHRRAFESGYFGTDDASLIEWTGGKVVALAGDYRNVKITTPEDLATAEAWLREERGELVRG